MKEIFEKYLRPSELCDFDKEIIQKKTEKIISGAKTDREKAERILDFCQNEILFIYDDWGVPASVVLERRKGMCSGKNNLAVAMLRAAGIPARHKLAILEIESEMWKFASERDSFLAKVLSTLPQTRDHIVIEVFLDGNWELKDVTRDRDLEKGMENLGIPLERDLILEELETIEDFDGWANQRQKRITIAENREKILKRINHFVESMRAKPSSPSSFPSEAR